MGEPVVWRGFWSRCTGGLLSVEVGSRPAFALPEVRAGARCIRGALLLPQELYSRRASNVGAVGARDRDRRAEPDSGTGELRGLSGTFHLDLDGGEHRYDLEYRLEAESQADE
ncbi:MAG: DUF3224 family protein [Acidobacteria bacterium]|nr:MAG: DUF3224 family protein [Acidobacteriota bacterium]REK09257.1 MAG: DUF3224 family protein [Acidobacteriota bacterium]